MLSLLLARRLLLGNGRAARALARACVCVRTLSANWQRTPMAQPSVATDVHQTLDIHLNSLAQVALNLALRLQNCSNSAQFILIQIFDARVEIDGRFVENRVRARAANTVDICKSDLSSLIRRKIDASYTCHCFLFSNRYWIPDLRLKAKLSRKPAIAIKNNLSLTLLMFGVDANHPHHSFAVDDLALVAHLFN